MFQHFAAPFLGAAWVAAALAADFLAVLPSISLPAALAVLRLAHSVRHISVVLVCTCLHVSYKVDLI